MDELQWFELDIIPFLKALDDHYSEEKLNHCISTVLSDKKYVKEKINEVNQQAEELQYSRRIAIHIK